MLDKEDHEFQASSSSNLGQARKAFLPPTIAIETTNSRTFRKRKLTDIEHGNDIGGAFTIKCHPSLPSPEAQKLIPRIQIPRSCLPLAYFDPLGRQDGLLGSNLFSAHIDSLEEILGKEDQCLGQPMVLIAQSARDDLADELFAIERVQEGIYAICRLMGWVKMNMLERLQIMPMHFAGPQERRLQKQLMLTENKWWSTAAIDIRSESRSDAGKASCSKKARGLGLCSQTPQIKSTTPAQLTSKIPPSIVQGQIGESSEKLEEEVAQEPQEVLKMVQIQYQGALYTSKSSLAYFAKGPLSRARAAFNISDGSANDRLHLTSFLRSCILSLALMDIKYRETLPDLIKALPFDTLSEEECTSFIGTISKKARRSKKINVGRNGLYSGEEANIARWWLSRDLSSIACDSVDAREEATKSAVLEQRTRETQLQIVLTLETLALELVASTHDVENLQAVNPPDGNDGLQDKKIKKNKKPQDLNMLLDLLIDRLCIWQSMGFDETKTLNGEDRPASQHGAKATAKATGSDQLRQFCVDVVLPFYGARLPELTTLICKKLGGPNKPSPRRPPLAKSASSSTSLKPGALKQRQQLRRPRRTLERVLTDEQSSSRKPLPSLSRSATAPILPQVKREVSDTTLSSIPLNRVAIYDRYNQREVDLYVTSQAAEAKLKKKARVEQELQVAIAALSKPNARMAVKDLVEDAERRATASHPRKPKKPVRNPFAQGAQVMATPSNNRHKDVYGGLPRFPRYDIAPRLGPEAVSQSSISCVPSISAKAQQLPCLAPDSIGKTSRSALPIVETPTRGPLKLWGHPPTSSAVMESHAVLSQLSSMSAALKIPKDINDLSTSIYQPLLVQETPLKSRSSHQVNKAGDTTIPGMSKNVLSAGDKTRENRTDPAISPLSHEKEESIYAALGWEDVDELL